MKRGQVSLDFALAIIMAGLLLTTLNSYTISFKDDTGALSEKAAARAMLLDAYAAAGTVQAYKRSATIGMEIDLNVSAPRSAQYSPCSVTFDSVNSQILATAGGATEKYSNISLTGLTFSSATTSCGSEVKIT